MKEKTYPRKQDLYRMPYSLNDNPIGWIEATDICNIKCKGCYRLIMGEGHKPKEQIKEEILFLKKWRNCDNITLAGGEPVLHPDMLENGQIDMCDSCPDMCVFEGRLVNSCRLDECRIFGDLLHIHVEEDVLKKTQKRRKKQGVEVE